MRKQGMVILGLALLTGNLLGLSVQTSQGQAQTNSQINICNAALSGDTPMISNTGDWLLRSDPGVWSADMMVGPALNLREKTLLALFASSLKQQGTTVMVAPLPPRGVIAYGSQAILNPLEQYPLTSAIAAYNRYILELRALGFEAVNPLDRSINTLSEYYFKRDHHWTPKGSQLTAQMLRDVYNKIGVQLNKNRFKVKDTSILQKYGTLATILEKKCGVKPESEPYTAFTVDDTQPNNSLTGADDVDAVIGTSNTDGQDLDFVTNLKLLTGIDFVNGAVTGGANFGAWENWLTTSNQTPARSMIWEQEYITMRYPERNVDSILAKIPQLVPRINDTCGVATDSLPLSANTFTPLNLNLKPRQFLKLELSDPQVRSLELDRSAGMMHDTRTLTKSSRIDNDSVFYSLNESEYTTYDNLQIRVPSALTLKYKVCDSQIPEQYGTSGLTPDALPLDLIRNPTANTYTGNLDSLENNKYRWTLDHHTLAEFLLEPDRDVTAQISFFNPIEGQNVSIFINSQRVVRFLNIKKGTTMQRNYTFRSAKKNEMVITYDKNNKTDPFAPKDSRALGILVDQWNVR